MSVVQFGENTVSIVLDSKRYTVRELEIEDEVINNTNYVSSHLIGAWKSHCLTKKNLIVNVSSFDDESFCDRFIVENLIVEIHFRLHKTSTGIFKDKRAVAFAVLQKS